MTIDGPDGMRYLVRRDGSPVAEGPIGLDELDPASRRIVEALLAAETASGRDKAGTNAGTNRGAQPRTDDPV